MASRSLTSREKNILRLGAAVAVVLLLSNGIPALTKVYQARADRIEQLRDEIAREQRLVDDTSVWRERRTQIEEQRPQLDSLVFPGNATPMLTAAIQRQVREYAAAAGVIINSTRLAESEQTEGWLKVEQSLSFTLTDQSGTLSFLRQLENAAPFLGVTDFSMRRNRNQYTGDITVVGLSRSAGNGSGGGQ